MQAKNSYDWTTTDFYTKLLEVLVANDVTQYKKLQNISTFHVQVLWLGEGKRGKSEQIAYTFFLQQSSLYNRQDSIICHTSMFYLIRSGVHYFITSAILDEYKGICV